MRIAISGTHGAGKTTLVDRLSEFYSLPVITEVARRVAVKPRHSIHNANDIFFALLRGEIERIEDYQADIFSTQIVEEIRTKAFISDRSILDVAAYSILYKLSPWHQKHYRTSAVLWASGAYDVVVYLPPPTNWIPENDGFRLTSNAAEYDKILRTLLEDTVIECQRSEVVSPVVMLPSVHADERDSWLSMAIERIEQVRGRAVKTEVVGS